MKKLLLLLALLLTLAQVQSFAADSDDHDVTGQLEECFCINNTDVGGTKYACGDTATLGIVSVAGTTFTLEDISVDTTTNSSTPYSINAAITGLTGPGGLLTTSISPASILTGGAPGEYNVGPFTPTVIVPVGTTAGLYTGTVTFTLTTT